MSVILTRSQGGGGASDTANQLHEVVTPASTVLIDSVSTGAYRSVKYIVSVAKTIGGLYTTYEILALVNATYNKYAIIGDVIDHTITIQVVGSYLEFSVTNNEAEDIIVDVRKALIST